MFAAEVQGIKIDLAAEQWGLLTEISSFFLDRSYVLIVNFM